MVPRSPAEGGLGRGEMRPKALADTGALLALLDADDRWHRACVTAFEELPLPLATTSAVLCELFHLLGDSEPGQAAVWRLLTTGALVLEPMAGEDLRPLEDLMVRYADRPMDFADATLVRLAERAGLSTVFTVDHADFETYRFAGRRTFGIRPLRQPVG
ncbi:MAG: PIN domain-containing protein [Acidobacteriota bacterium]